MTLILNIGLPCKQFYGCSWSCHTETPLEVWDDFVIVMEIKHQRCAIYLPLRTTHKSTSLLTPEALARPQSILSRAAMPSSGCNIFNNNIAELSSGRHDAFKDGVLMVLSTDLPNQFTSVQGRFNPFGGIALEILKKWQYSLRWVTPVVSGENWLGFFCTLRTYFGKNLVMRKKTQKKCSYAGLVVIGPTEQN